MDYFSTKELYSVQIKSTSSLEIGEKTFIAGETVLQFDELQLSVLEERRMRIVAEGGFNNLTQIVWEDTTNVDFLCENGVMSQEAIAIWTNSKLLKKEQNSVIVSYSETKESDVDGKIVLKYAPLPMEFFLYDENMNLVTIYTLSTKTISGLTPFKDYIIRYLFTYAGDANVLNIGQRLLNGHLKLTAKMRLKDDSTGQIKTGILEIPRVRLMSNLSMRLGANIVPVVSTFKLQGEPVGERNSRYVCQFYYLNTDIEA